MARVQASISSFSYPIYGIGGLVLSNFTYYSKLAGTIGLVESATLAAQEPRRLVILLHQPCYRPPTDGLTMLI